VHGLYDARTGSNRSSKNTADGNVGAGVGSGAGAGVGLGPGGVCMPTVGLGVGGDVAAGDPNKESGSIHQSVNDPSTLEPMALTHPGTSSARPF